MTLQGIAFDRKALTIMGVRFPDAETLESTAAALASQMYEGFRPTPRHIEIIRDYNADKITLQDVFDFIKGSKDARLSVS